MLKLRKDSLEEAIMSKVTIKRTTRKVFWDEGEKVMMKVLYLIIKLHPSSVVHIFIACSNKKLPTGNLR
jgi:hypothetical protein